MGAGILEGGPNLNYYILTSPLLEESSLTCLILTYIAISMINVGI